QPAVDVHVADSLAGLELEEVRVARSIADVGSGAGFPGLVLAIARSDSEVSLIESQARRCMFLERAVAETGIANAAVVCTRAEEWEGGNGRHDLVVARALAPLPVVLEYASPLLAVGGWLVDWRGARAPAQEREAAVAASELGKKATAVNRGACIAEAGYGTLLVDVDPQANATVGLGVPRKGHPGLYEVLTGQTEAAQAITDTRIPGLRLLPAGEGLAGANVELPRIEGFERRLAECLAPVYAGFEYVLLDCPPSLGPLTVSALVAA